MLAWFKRFIWCRSAWEDFPECITSERQNAALRLFLSLNLLSLFAPGLFSYAKSKSLGRIASLAHLSSGFRIPLAQSKETSMKNSYFWHEQEENRCVNSQHSFSGNLLYSKVWKTRSQETCTGNPRPRLFHCVRNCNFSCSHNWGDEPLGPAWCDLNESFISARGTKRTRRPTTFVLLHHSMIYFHMWVTPRSSPGLMEKNARCCFRLTQRERTIA